MSSFLSFVRTIVMVSVVTTPALAAAGSIPPAVRVNVPPVRATVAPGIVPPTALRTAADSTRFAAELDRGHSLSMIFVGVVGLATVPILAGIAAIPTIVVVSVALVSGSLVIVGGMWHEAAVWNYDHADDGSNVARDADTSGSIVVRDSAPCANAGMHH